MSGLTCRIILASALAATLAGPAQVVPLLCTVDQKFECSREGCVPGLPGRIFNRIDPERGTYARCDANGCDTYPARFVPSGAFINVELPGQSAFAKLSDARHDPHVGEFRALHLLEVVTLGMVALVSYGWCTEDPE